jgi:hypothetical protein
MKRELMLSPQAIAERLDISLQAARDRMAEMPGCVDIGAGKNRVLRVPESGLEAWLSNKVVVIGRSTGKLARRRGGKLQAV